MRILHTDKKRNNTCQLRSAKAAGIFLFDAMKAGLGAVEPKEKKRKCTGGKRYFRAVKMYRVRHRNMY
jgi:hypothetical protein